MYYNFFRPHESLEGKTPAEAGKIKYDVKDWAGLIKIPVPKHRIEFVDSPKTKRVKTVIDTSKLLSRKRGHRTPKVGLTTPHRTRRGNGITRQG